MEAGSGEQLLGHQRQLLRKVVAGRRFVVALDTLVGAAGLAEVLREHGADDVLLVGGNRGTGDLRAEVAADAIDLQVDGRGVMGGIRAFIAALQQPPASLVDSVERFDPSGEALVATAVNAADEQLLGRPVFGRRLRSWAMLEDKTVIDSLWDAAGVAQAPWRVVPVEAGGLWCAHQELEGGQGTVWAADNRSGWHGGGHGLRWVRTSTDAERATAELAPVADQVRVMPFLDGRPCSIHGWVIGDAIATFRPCETVMLRETSANRLHYAGSATSWTPSARDRDAMRDLARQVGEHLRKEHQFRGVFTVDGVLTSEGFRPTELNPRFGAALGALGKGAQLPLYALHSATVERPELDWRPAQLEADVLKASLDYPHAGGHIVLDQRTTATRTVALQWRHERLIDAADPTTADATLELGPSPGGSLLRATFHHPELGPAVAPAVANAFQHANQIFELELPDLESAPDLRS